MHMTLKTLEKLCCSLKLPYLSMWTTMHGPHLFVIKLFDVAGEKTMMTQVISRVWYSYTELVQALG
jgi:hypothetical protein